jgi:hypothetical protein
VFDGNGRCDTPWVNMLRPSGGIYYRGPKAQVIVGDLGPGRTVTSNHTNIGPRLSIAEGVQQDHSERKWDERSSRRY